jgi:hypothetical protein
MSFLFSPGGVHSHLPIDFDFFRGETPMVRAVCEGSHSLDVRVLHRKDLLRPKLWFDWSRTRNNEPAGKHWASASRLDLDPDTVASQNSIVNPIETRIVSHQGASLGRTLPRHALQACIAKLSGVKPEWAAFRRLFIASVVCATARSSSNP